MKSWAFERSPAPIIVLSLLLTGAYVPTASFESSTSESNEEGWFSGTGAARRLGRSLE